MLRADTRRRTVIPASIRAKLSLELQQSHQGGQIIDGQIESTRRKEIQTPAVETLKNVNGKMHFAMGDATMMLPNSQLLVPRGEGATTDLDIN